MNVYADHNFLIYCVKEPAWRKAVTEAHHSGQVTMVLSPWHFYEYGNASAYEDTQDLIEFAEELQPKWILERGDLQQREFFAVWNSIWGGVPLVFNPISTLADVGASLNRVPIDRMSRYSIRDYVKSFSVAGALDDIKTELQSQIYIAKFNRDKYVNDKLFNNVLSNSELMYAAVQFARLHQFEREKVYALANQLLGEQPLSTQIQYFVYWRCTEFLKAYMTEVALTLELIQGTATLVPNRQIDRQHAIVALPYCDLLITDDEDLSKRIARVRGRLRFTTANVLRGEAFIKTL